MDIGKCEILSTVLECGNIRKAAESLGYTPSGVSRAIASLEQECGLTLLVRSKSGVSPTESCKALLPFITRAISHKQALEREARELAGLESGMLRVGTAYPRFHDCLASLLGDFHRKHQGVEISLVEGNSTPLLQMLEDGKIDLAIASKREGDFAWHPIAVDRLVVLVPPAHPLAKGERYPLKRLESDSYIDIGPGEETDNALILRGLGIRPNVCYSISTDITSYKMVDAGLGVCLTNSLHKRSYKGSSVFLETDPAVSVEIGVASAPDEIASPAAKEFRTLLVEALG